MASNIHRTPPQEPLTFRETPDSLLLKTKEFSIYHKQNVSELTAQINPEAATWENFLLPIVLLDNEWASSYDIIKLYSKASPNDEMRAASRECLSLFNQLEMSLPNIWNWIERIHSNGAVLEPEPQRVVDSIRKAFAATAGCSSKTRLNQIDRRITEVRSKFDSNAQNDNSGIWASEAELAGVPDKVLKDLEKGTGEQSGKYFTLYKSNAGVLMMQHAIDSEFRKKIYCGRANSRNNSLDLFKELISLRHEKANLIGKPDFMTQRLEGTMMRNPDAVRTLLPRFRKRVAKIGVLESLKEEKLLDDDVEDKILYLWDEFYYKRVWLEKKFSVNYLKIAEYFPVWSTIDGMLDIFGQLFGLDFEPVVDADVWHEDVRLYAVWNKEQSGGEFSGYLYVDPLPRLGKAANASCFEVQPSFINHDGIRTYGISALVASLPELMHHTHVITLFHELGHGMHQLLSRATYARFHGSRETYDFNEVPSVLLENWCWLPSQLKRLSRHYITGATIPDDLVTNIARTKDFVRILDLFQVVVATFDMLIYTPASQKIADEMDPAEIFNSLLCEITGLQGPKDSMDGVNELGNGHLLRGHQVSGCPATYYKYITSFCFAEKIWDAIFAHDPMNQEAAMRYRRIVLERGGTRDPFDMLEELLGKRLEGENLL